MLVFPRIQLSLSSSVILPGCGIPCFSVVRLIEVGATHLCMCTYESQQSSATTRCSLFSMQGGRSILNVGGGGGGAN